jgi:polyhydroxybutyrate depolymerase
VLVLHGRGGSGAAVARLTGFAARADSAGFIAVFPDAVTRRWNDGRLSTGPDDVGFLAALVSELAGEYGVDTSRVYVTGMSNGAIMCFRLAAERPGVFAAIAPVAGSMSRQSLDTWQVERPVPVLMVNGTLDPVVRYRGGKELASVVRTARFWVLANGCGPNPETLAVPGPTPGDSTSVTCERWTGKGKSEVLLYTVVGGGHTWPSGGARPARFGPTSRDIDATRLIWEFFTRHRLGETSR